MCIYTGVSIHSIFVTVSCCLVNECFKSLNRSRHCLFLVFHLTYATDVPVPKDRTGLVVAICYDYGLAPLTFFLTHVCPLTVLLLLRSLSFSRQHCSVLLFVASRYVLMFESDAVVCVATAVLLPQ